MSPETADLLKRVALRCRFNAVSGTQLYDYDLGPYCENNPFQYVRSEAYRADDADAAREFKTPGGGDFKGTGALIVQYNWPKAYKPKGSEVEFAPDVEKMNVALEAIMKAIFPEFAEHMKFSIYASDENTNEVVGDWIIQCEYRKAYEGAELEAAYRDAAHLEMVLCSLFDVMPWVILEEAGDNRFGFLKAAALPNAYDNKPENKIGGQDDKADAK